MGVAVPTSPQQQPASSPPPGLTGAGSAQQQAIAQVQTILASGLPMASMLPALTVALGGVGVSSAGVIAAALMFAQRALRLAAVLGAVGVAAVLIRRWERSYQAAYLVAAAQRMQEQIDAGAALAQVVTSESRFYRMHLHATENRRRTAASVDRLARRHGLLLGWKATLDSRTSPECRAADGHNFRVDDPPVIGLPGAVHPHCRCRPVAPYPDAELVDDVLTVPMLAAV